MNRTDEISAVARDIAEQINPDPATRDAVADNLVKLVALVVAAVGKSVAGHGESELNDVLAREFELDTESIEYSPSEVEDLEADFNGEQRRDAVKYHCMYLTGEQIQDGARWVQEEAVCVDLDRWDGTPHAWVSKLTCSAFCTVTVGGKHLRCVPVAADEPEDDGELDDSWEGPYGDGPEDLYREVAEPSDDGYRCPECNRSVRFGHMFNCSLDDRDTPDVDTGHLYNESCPGTCCGGDESAGHSMPIPTRCTVMAVGGGRCTKNHGHRPPGSDDPHTFS